MSDMAICILAGGQATRLPGKLEMDFQGQPLVVRVFENLRGSYPIYISAKGAFGAPIDAVLQAPMIVDRWIGRGPLAGLITVFSEVLHERMFVVAGDAPFVNTQTLQTLREGWRAGDEAVVAEPLLALYDRAAFLKAAWPVFSEGSAAVKDVIAILAARTVRVELPALTNINTPGDLRGVREKYTPKYEELF